MQILQRMSQQDQAKVLKLCDFYGLNQIQTKQLLQQLHKQSQTIQANQDVQDQLLNSPLFLKVVQENKALKQQKDCLLVKFDSLLKMKQQESQVILSLKDSIQVVSTLLRQKQNNISNLHQKIQRLRVQSRSEFRNSRSIQTQTITSSRQILSKSKFKEGNGKNKRYKAVLDQLRHLMKR